MLDSASFATVILLSTAFLLLLAAMFYPASLLRWFRRKRYQYEVTFSLYMLTPMEKFIFNSILFLLLSLFIIAASLYLPEHISLIASRVAYYFSGNEDTFGAGVQKPGMAASDMGSNDILAQQQRMGAGAMAGPGRGFMEP